MNFAKYLLSKTGTVIAAIALTAGLSQAGDMRFNLPFDAVWNGVHLTQGQYTMSTETVLRDVPLLRLSGNGKTVAIPMHRSSMRAYEGAVSQLHIVKVNGVEYVQEFQSASSNVSTRFHVPKASTMELAKQTGAAGNSSLALSLK